ncbi:putative ribonuclease H-like domain-containing protein [Tanacetum coccineum]|uniref:Ribonuclease H-like domain-containing protein n=1 Tax=Tanacetum coccineum TaxID=301880 RepID=A0ABQ5J6Z4_9ASTR
MNFFVFKCSKEDSIGKPLYSRFTKTNDFKGVPHPLSGDYTPKPQEEIDDSLYVYGKKGPQKPEISISDENSSEHSTCQSNDSEGSCENTSEHSFETRIGKSIQLMLVWGQSFNSVRPNINTGRTNISSGRPKVNTVSPKVNTVRPRQPAPHTTSNIGDLLLRPQQVIIGGTLGQTSIITEHPLKNMVDRGIFDSGCSGHMTGNKDQLEDFEEFNGGSVTFGGSKGYISRKGRIRVGNLDFDSVSFVKELGHFNLFSISQICDKQHKVLFTETECLVVSSDFKMPDENQILLKVPRHHNMYSFDMKTPSPAKGFACLIAKATSDESKLWHRRLGHINFKNLNKLVKGNLVRGLPSKVFQNDHTCVACHKGKQHRASCKAKLERLITKPLHTLHMDLFGPTSVKSINHASYCLVITDDCTRFCWVFFLASKDETSGILQTFIRQIENQLSHKVKIIRSDNGTEFKNRDMLEFCDTLSVLGKFDGKSDEGFLVEKPNVKGVGYRWMFDIDYLTDSMNYIPVSLENQANNAGISEETNSAGTSQTPESIASEEKDEEVELIVVPSAVNIPEEKDESRTSSTYSKKEETLTEPQKEMKDSSTDPLEDNPKIQAFRRELEEIALKHLGTVNTGIPSVNTGIQTVNTGRLDHDDSLMPELEIFHKPETGIFDEASYYESFHISRGTKKIVESYTNLPHGMKVIGTKWVYRTKRDERGVVVRNKAKSWRPQGLQVKQNKGGIFISQDKYVAEILKKFDLVTPKNFLISMLQEELQVSQGHTTLVAYAFSDSDYGGSNLDRKSTTGGCQFLGQRLISWQCKKQTIVATSTTEAEYVAAANCCGQVLVAEIVDFLRGFQPQIFGNMKRGFRGAPRPLLPAMLLVATNPNAGQEHDAVAQSIPTPTPPPIPTPTPPPIPTPTPPPIPTPTPIPDTEPTPFEHIYEEE